MIIPKTPPMSPPAPCSMAKKATPPNILERYAGFMKKLPIITPATHVDTSELETKIAEPINPRSMNFLYPMANANKSKIMLPTVNPKKWRASGLRMKFNKVATIPMKDTAPGFLVHHRVIMKREVPIISHSTGRCVSCQNMGAMSQFSTAHRDADKEIAARSRVLKYCRTPTLQCYDKAYP